MKRLVLAAAASAVLAACGDGSLDKKVLLIGLDGIRVDVLAEVPTPHLDSLIGAGLFSDAAQTADPTWSGPCWSSMLTGVWPEKHGVYNNRFEGKNYTTYPDFLTRLEQLDTAFNTFAVVDWLPLGWEVSGGPLLSDAIDRLLVFSGDQLGYADADSVSVLAAVEYLETADPDAAFVYIGNVDEVGHATSTLAPEYRAAMEVADAHVGALVAAVRRRPTYANEDWLILVSTDHGRTDDGGHGGYSPQEATIFYLAAGPSVVRGAPAEPPGVVDVAVTALAHLGVEIDPAWQLDGKVVGLASRP
jgi:predicted AlkP superfamily pyrophosphatase or phosphodiesterase